MALATPGLGGLRLGQADGTELVGFGLAGEADVRRFTRCLGLAGLGLVLADVDRHGRTGQLGLHVGGALGLLRLDAGRLRPLLLDERRSFLVGDLSPGQDLDEFLGEYDVLDVDAAGLDLVCRRYCVTASRAAARPGGSR